MKINNKIVMLAMALGIITTIAMYFYITDIKNAEAVPVPMTTIVTAANTIPIHVRITEEMLTTLTIPSAAVHPDAIFDKSKIIGGVTNAEIVKGEQILSERVISEAADTALSYRIPDKMRAITLGMDEVSGVGGYISVGDKVDILVYYADPAHNPKNEVNAQFQNIEILELGPNVTTENKEAVPSSITFLVTPDQAEQLTFARLNARIAYSLRNNIDNAIIP